MKSFEPRGTLNLFELFSSDLQMSILTFLNIQDLYRVSLSCQHGATLVLSPEADHFVWQPVARQLVFNHNQEAMQQFMQEQVRKQVKTCTGEDEMTNEERTAVDGPPNMWRELVREASMMKWAPDSRTSDTSIKLHNNNKTISCEKYSDWNTVRTDRKLEMGMIHCWEYTLDYYDNSDDNGYRIFVGIERSSYAFTEVGYNKVIGLNSQGVSYNISVHSTHTQMSITPIWLMKRIEFNTGDTIAIKLDLKNLTNSKTASMCLFRNNEYFHTISDIPTQDIEYYPAISVIGQQIVSIRMKHRSLLCREL